MQKPPLTNQYYLHKSKIYKTLSVSRGTDIITVQELESGSITDCYYGTFMSAFKRVIKVGELAKLLGRHPRSIYRYESKGVIEKAVMYTTKYGSSVRFYTLDQVLEVHEMISLLHQGRPRKDRKIINNLMDPGSFRALLREKY
jgi:hypothetical protein